MTLQEERAALQKRMDEIDAEIAGFVPGWYEYWDEEHCGRLQYMESIGLYNEYKSCYQHVEPFHLVAHKFLPEGWRVVRPESKTLYDWSKAPEWANWAAMNENGEVWWSEGKPKILEGYDGLWCAEKQWKLARRATALSRSVPWDQSLEQRPKEA